MLECPRRAREKVCLMGPWGAGKSFAWCSVAQWNKRTANGAKVYVIDTDHACDKHSTMFDGFEDHVTWRDVYEWPDYIKAMDEFLKVATRDDWLVVDLADAPWAAVQDWYIEEAYGKDSAAFFLEWKKESTKGGNPLADGFGTNWQVINKQYNSFISKVMRWPGHRMFCTKAEPLREADKQGKGGESQETLSAYGSYRVKPGGQKNLGFQSETVILLNPKGNERWSYSSIKDLHRERPQNKEIKDFVMDYLVGVAGWTI